MPVDTRHDQYSARFADWEQISDCLEGQRKIKSKGHKYLPRPNAADTSKENDERYKSYLIRSLFYNSVDVTISNMAGQCFAIDPTVTAPDQIKPWLADIDGGGVSAIQQSKQALRHVLSYSRAGLWVDYPKTTGLVSIADAETGAIRPRLVLFDAFSVINWRTETFGGVTKLSMVVIEETYIKKDDGFKYELGLQWRVLSLVENKYQIELWRKGDGDASFVLVDFSEPLDGNGQRMAEIPFQFLGAETNSPIVEKPLILDISNINLAHYRNSADYEENSFVSGQGTLVISGVDQRWNDEVLKNTVSMGSHGGIALPQGANATLLQAAPNSVPFEAMIHKEKLMFSLGAKFVQQSQVSKTATESGINQSNQTSVLAAACVNVSAAYSRALQQAAEFGGVKTQNPLTDILWELNTDFATSRMQPQEVAAILSLYQGNVITFEETRDKLKSGGIAYLDDESAKDEMAAKSEADFLKVNNQFT